MVKHTLEDVHIQNDLQASFHTLNMTCPIGRDCCRFKDIKLS